MIGTNARINEGDQAKRQLILDNSRERNRKEVGVDAASADDDEKLM